MMAAIDPKKFTAAHRAGDTEAVGQMILDLAGSIVGEHVQNCQVAQIVDKYDADDLQSELAMYALRKIPNLRSPDRLFSFTYTVMTRRLFKLLKRARAKQQHAQRYRNLTAALYRPEALMVGEDN